MRKIALFSIFAVLALVLSSCVIVAAPTISNFEFGSDWKRTSDNALVLCSNQSSRIAYSFTVSDGTVAKVVEIYHGNISGRPDQSVDRTALLSKSGNTFSYVSAPLGFGNNGIPQSIGGKVSTQAITITPTPTVPASKTGETVLTVQVTTSAGTTQSASYQYDVYSNCPTN